jgi:SPP1 family predicted phage head-tail adaptor
MRHRLTIEAPGLADDGAGGLGDPWAEPFLLATVWARIEALSGRETVQAGGLTARSTHRITIRRREDVTSSTRLRAGGRIYRIRAILDRDEGGRWLEIYCEQGVAT